MVRNTSSLCCLALVTLLAGCAAGSADSAATPPTPTEEVPDPTTADGIYTLSQAARGEALYDEVCAECHDATDWTDSGFKARWETQSVFQLWYYINDRMPYEDPFTLTRQEVTDALTYILSLNGLPAGDVELATDDDSIDDYWIEWRRP